MEAGAATGLLAAAEPLSAYAGEVEMEVSLA